jgi:hypothetical protein
MKADTIRTSVDLPKALHRRLHEAAARKGCSARQLILAALERTIEEGPKRPRKRLDLRKRPLVPATGQAINITNEQIYDLAYPFA